jgi:hypothetical protein
MSGTSSTNDNASTSRIDALDGARGALLVAMVLVHVVSAHASASQVNFLHHSLGVFLVSSGFVGISGFVIGLRPGLLTRRDIFRALDAALHLVLVMFAYGVLLALARYYLRSAAGGAQACSTQHGWAPPVRFDDLGILLPIALVQLLAPLSRARTRIAVGSTLVLAVAGVLLPGLTVGADARHGLGIVAGVLAQRTLTPFYSVSIFVAVGLTLALAARLRLWRTVLGATPPAPAVGFALVLSLVAATPAVSHGVLDPLASLLGNAGAGITTLLYWTFTIALFIAGFARLDLFPASLRRGLTLLGRNSLLAFVTHDFLLELNTFAHDLTGAPKGIGVVGIMSAVDVGAMLLVCFAVERWPSFRDAATASLLNRTRGSRLRTGAFTPFGALALAGVLAVYTGSAMARHGENLILDDFEATNECPRWWSFGTLTYHRAQASSDPKGQAQHYLEVRGQASGTFVDGRGLYLLDDIGERRTLRMDVRGYGQDSGRIRIELYDDDNGNWEIEKDPRSYAPLYDDLFVYELAVDWNGWRQVELPLALFKDDNPTVGNNVLDPQRDLTSGGLLEIQLLFGPTRKENLEVAIDLDNLRWTP